MYYGYYVRDKGSNSLFTYSNGEICKKTAGGTATLGMAASPLFYITLRDKSPLVVYKNKQQAITLWAEGEQRILQQSSPYRAISCIAQRGGTRLIYISDQGDSSLVTVKSQGGNREEAEKLDKPLGNPPYRLIPMVNGGWGLIYVRKNGKNNELGYREVTLGAVGPFKGIYTTNFAIGDSSLCVNGQGVHLAFTLASPFAVRVMYAQNSGKGFTKAKTLWEGRSCSWVCLAGAGGCTYVWWEGSNSIFATSTRGEGEAFGQCEKLGQSGAKVKIGALGFGYGISQLAMGAEGNIIAPPQVLQALTPYEVEEDKKTPQVEANNRQLDLLKAEIVKKQQQIEQLTYALQSQMKENICRENLLRSRNKELKTLLNNEKNGLKADI